MPGAARRGEPRRITVAEAAALARSGDWLDYGSHSASPTASIMRWRRQGHHRLGAFGLPRGAGARGAGEAAYTEVLHLEERV